MASEPTTRIRPDINLSGIKDPVLARILQDIYRNIANVINNLSTATTTIQAATTTIQAAAAENFSFPTIVTPQPARDIEDQPLLYLGLRPQQPVNDRLVLYGTSATPPDPTGYQDGTLYVQYI